MTNDNRLESLPRTVELSCDVTGVPFLTFVDQRQLPGALVLERTQDWREVIEAIKTLAIRGAPAIGVAGAAALALWVSEYVVASCVALQGMEEPLSGVCEKFRANLCNAADEIAQARPTAVNLRWAVVRLEGIGCSFLAKGLPLAQISELLFAEVKRMEAEDEAANRALGAHGAALLPRGSRILTHCNAGSLATVFYGTALGVVYAAAEQGKIERVYADETRPVGQGARLTAWELSRAGVPCTLICDSMAASLMAQGRVDAVVVGADRIAANGDVANKIGTFGVAVLARHHDIPFYVAAPTSTIDLSTETGAAIPIEERATDEVVLQAIEGVDVWNPAFDVTPAALITRIVTERGVVHPSDLRLVVA